jgi:hypothetical protein
MEQGLQRLDRQLTIPQNLVEEAWADCFTRVYRNDCGSSIFMTDEVMTATNPNCYESSSLQCGD